MTAFSVGQGVAMAVGRGLTQAGAGGGASSLTAQVQSLFTTYSAVGGMWDFSDMGTMFQDSAGSTPVTAASQPVGRVLDVSGQGRTLQQTTSAARPTYNGAGITPDAVDDFLVTSANLNLTACDKVIVGMGYRKVDGTTRVQAELSALPVSAAFSHQSSVSQTVNAQGSLAGTNALFGTERANEYGAHIARHSIPGDLSEVWWNGTKGTNGTGDKGTGNFGNFPLYLFSRAGTGFFTNTPTRRALVFGIPVAGPQMSDGDIELIREWLMEGSA